MSKKVIDVSYAQGCIDWEKVKPHIDGAILRCGYGMDQPDQDDEQFKRNAGECTRLGIPFGVYLYSYATNSDRAKSEAAHALRLVKGYKLSYPIYLDLEQNGTQSGAVERARIFGKAIEEAGYVCGIYANLNWWNNYLKGLDEYTKWVAQYYKECQYRGTGLDMWQYSSSGSIEGIGGRVDLNECYRDFPAEIQNGGKAQESTPAPQGPAINTTKEVYTMEMRMLRKGDTGEDVRALQILLNGRGYDCGPDGSDGIFGDNTDAALRSYQSKTGKEVDGIAGPESMGGLLGV